MMKSAKRIINAKYAGHEKDSTRRRSFREFLLRYPIFLFAFGPPVFRLPRENVDATKGILDIWSFIQVGLLLLIASRAIWRLVSARSIILPKIIRSILILIFIFNVLLIVSATYSPSRIVSAAYAIFYFLTLICVYEFVLDIYNNPPNILHFLYHLRLIAIMLLILDIVVLFINPQYIVLGMGGAVIRFGGGTVGPTGVICPMIAIISAYMFLHSLESRVRAALLFIVGLIGTFGTRTRGNEIAFIISFAILVYFWARIGRHTAYMFVSLFSFFILLFGLIVQSVGGERLWDWFNRGQSLGGIESASGRTDIWYFVIQYCTSHPWGMGYIAGFRMLFRQYYALGLSVNVNGIGNAHNTYIQVLSDAGWLAIAIYLVILVRIIRIAWRFANEHNLSKSTLFNNYRMTIECSLVLLIYYLVAGISNADYIVPLKITFYWQFILIAIILGASATMIAAYRARGVGREK